MANRKSRTAAPVEESLTSSVSLDLAASTFLGTLPADAGERVELVGVFAETYRRFVELRTQYRSGLLDKITFGRALSEMRCIDVDGGQWMIGASSGQWYHRANPDDEWRATPPDAAIRAEVRRGLGRGPALEAATTPSIAVQASASGSPVTVPASTEPSPAMTEPELSQEVIRQWGPPPGTSDNHQETSGQQEPGFGGYGSFGA